VVVEREASGAEQRVAVERNLQIVVLAVVPAEVAGDVVQLEARVAAERARVRMIRIQRILRIEEITVLIDEVVAAGRQEAERRGVAEGNLVLRQVRAAEAARVRARILPAADDPVAVLAVDDLALAEVCPEQHVAAAVAEVRAEEAADRPFRTVPLLRDRVLRIDVEAFEVSLQDE